MEEKYIKQTSDGKVKCLVSLGTCIPKQDIAPKYQYFLLKMLTTAGPIIIQYPATILLLLLVTKDCNGYSKNKIGVGGSIALFGLSIIFHTIRSRLQGKNAYFLYYAQFTSCYQIVSILAMHGFVFIDLYHQDIQLQCGDDNLYNMLYYCMLIWIIYDNMSIIGIIVEFIFNYAEIAKKVVPFLSILIIGSVMIIQLPANIGSLYVILKYDIKSTFTLSSNKIVSFLIVIWVQILVYATMQNRLFGFKITLEEKKRIKSKRKLKIESKKIEGTYDYSIFPVWFFLFIIHILSLESFLFWIFVDDVTVTSVIFSILFGAGLFYDTISLLCPTVMVPMAAYQFYGIRKNQKRQHKNGMVRAMILQFIIFICVQMPACIMQLLKIWKGNVNTVSGTEGSALFVLTWMSLIIQFVYTFLYFDNDPQVKEFIHDNYYKLYKMYSMKNLEIYMKYILYLNTLIIWIIIIHCFSFWTQEKHIFKWIWWFFLVWIIIYTISSVGPALVYIWLMFYYRNLKKLVNNAYIFMAVFVYVFIQLPASILQLIMVEFNKCKDYYGHTLDDDVVESFFILLFTLIQLVLFYAICDILGWNYDAQQAKIEMTNSKQDLYRDKEIHKYAKLSEKLLKKKLKKLTEKSQEFKKLRFKTMKQLKKAINLEIEKINDKKVRDKFMNTYGIHFLRLFIIVCIIQFGLSIHCYTYWTKNSNQIDCGCDTIDTMNNPDCTDWNVSKKILKFLFLFWIISYSFIPFASIGLNAFRQNIENMIKKRLSNEDAEKENNQ